MRNFQISIVSAVKICKHVCKLLQLRLQVPLPYPGPSVLLPSPIKISDTPLLHTETCNLACTDLLMNPDRIPKTRSVWPTLWVKIARRKSGHRHFLAS